MDSMRLAMTQSSSEMLSKQICFFICRDAFFTQKICAKGILKIPCLFCFGFLETWERPKTSSPESKELDCELASESIYMR